MGIAHRFALALVWIAVVSVPAAPFVSKLRFSTRLADNEFFVAHKEAALVASRVDQPWDLEWALPLELRDRDTWRAAVASLPPAALRGARAVPEPNVEFVGWPPIALAD